MYVGGFFFYYIFLFLASFAHAYPPMKCLWNNMRRRGHEMLSEAMRAEEGLRAILEGGNLTPLHDAIKVRRALKAGIF
jgi:hypothetical protein